MFIFISSFRFDALSRSRVWIPFQPARTADNSMSLFLSTLLEVIQRCAKPKHFDITVAKAAFHPMLASIGTLEQSTVDVRTRMLRKRHRSIGGSYESRCRYPVESCIKEECVDTFATLCKVRYHLLVQMTLPVIIS